MKRNIFNLIIFAAVLVLGSCNKGPVEHPGNGNNGGECTTKGKFENIGCGWGLYESYWIRLEDGTLLQPCQSDVPNIDINEIYDGMPIELGYFGVKNSFCAESPFVCCMAPPQHETVRITCIKVLGRPRCPDSLETNNYNQAGILRDFRGKLDGCSWIIELNSGEKLEVLPQQIDETIFSDNTAVIVGYNKVKRFSACMAGTPVDLTCIRAAGGTTCNEAGILRDWRGKLDGCGWIIELNSGEKLEVLPQQIDETKFSDNMPVLVGYTRVYRGSICMTGTPVDLMCITAANTLHK